MDVQDRPDISHPVKINHVRQAPLRGQPSGTLTHLTESGPQDTPIPIALN